MTADAIFRGRLIMAPMSRGTDLPFRRLLREWGAEVCVGEMAYAHKIVKRERSELPLIRRHPDEKVSSVYSTDSVATSFQFGSREATSRANVQMSVTSPT